MVIITDKMIQNDEFSQSPNSRFSSLESAHSKVWAMERAENIKGQSQVRNEQSVKIRPALQVSAHAALMLASIETNHDQEIDDEGLPSWRKKSKEDFHTKFDR